MSVPAIIDQTQSSLPQLVDHAAAALSNARTAAEVLEARELASFAYDVAKRAARLQRAKVAHDDLIAATHRAQANALEIEAQAKRRLAAEYDAAQERGEVQADGRPKTVPDGNGFIPAAATAADLGISRKDIHEARVIRDAEEADPGIVRRTLDEKLARGEEPTRSAVRRAAEARLQRSVDRLRRVQESVRRLEAEEVPPPLTPEQRAVQLKVFGTQEDRAVAARIHEITELADEQPEPAEALRRIPPASIRAVKATPIRRAAAWLNQFADLLEQETQHGNHASE